ncbi:MAG: hypothetical protein ACOYXT_08930 [Bacteroidota bacterium]
MKRISWLSFLVFLAMACQDQIALEEEQSKSLQKAGTKNSSNARALTENGVGCGEIRAYPLIANGVEVGSVTMSVDDAGLNISYDLSSSEWFLLDVKAFAGDCNAIPDPGNFPHQVSFNFDDEVRSFSFTIPWENLPDCGCIEALATVGRYNPRTSVIDSFPAGVHSDYCNCDEPEQPTDSLECDGTITQLVTANGAQQGTVTMNLSDSVVYVSYDLSSSEWFMLMISASAGTCGDGAPQGFNHDVQFLLDDEVRSHSFEIPLSKLPECGCIQSMVVIARFNPVTSQIETRQSVVNATYCKCEEPNDGNLRTQTQGGWGAPPNGNNPGAYLHANFLSAFPNGLVVGCNYTITLTSAQAVTDFLPQGGTPSALKKNYVDPVDTPKHPNNPKNTLAGQVVALRLSVGFDNWDEDFGESNTDLADATITQGTFAGWTVAQVLAEAEKVLGGCASSYRAAQLNDVVTAINESFVDGTTNTGFLITH